LPFAPDVVEGFDELGCHPHLTLCGCLWYAAADRPFLDILCGFFLEETHHRLQRFDVIVSRGASRQLRHELRV
jgi:hypothetical protein